jgi:hypothetical protein
VFGSPLWDVAAFERWDGIDGRSAFDLLHRAELPTLPRGMHASALLAARTWRNLARVVPPMLMGPGGLWLGALACWPFTQDARADARVRPLVAAAVVLGVGLALDTLAASAGTPLLRNVFPTRALAGVAGLFALWSMLRRVTSVSERTRNVACVLAALVSLGWGTWTTRLAGDESRTSSLERGVPSSRTLTALSVTLSSVLTPGETLMSNLGPALAWQTHHPVIGLASSPAEVAACRARHDFHHLVLVFRSADRAWAPWQEIVERPGAAATHTELGVSRERRYTTVDGFGVVWLELGPRQPELAFRPRGPRRVRRVRLLRFAHVPAARCTLARTRERGSR